MKNRSGLRICLSAAACCVVVLLIAGCGKNYYFAGRTLPPSKLTNRVLMAIQNTSSFSKGGLVFVDGYYDIRHSVDNKTSSFTISGFGGADPKTIQNLPEQQIGAIYSSGDGSFELIDYAGEKVSGPVSGLAGLSSSIFITQDLKYVFAANQQSHVLTVIDRSLGKTFYLNLPGVYRLSVNPSGTVVLAFVQNTNSVYTVTHLNAEQQVAAANSSDPQHFQIGNQTAQDCEPQNLPQYCVFPVSDPNSNFDRPVKAIYAADGSTAYVLNCGPECGGNKAGVVNLPITSSSLNAVSTGPAGLNFTPGTAVSVPGGVTNAIQSGNTLYLAGQKLLADGLFTGVLSAFDMVAQKVTGSYSISDGDHGKMIFADDNTLWIGSTGCLLGERYKLSQTSSGASTQFGCLTSFNTSSNAVFIDTYKGDLTGIASVTQLHKIYVAEGGQVHIYNTSDGSERDNTNVTVAGTVYDVAYMDGISDGNNTTY